MQKFGIDISKWQGDFDIQKAKNNGVEFAILKIGGGDSVCYKDSQFENNYTKCENADMPKGCYFFGQALTKQKAVEEANYWLSLMKNHKFEYPVFYDVEAKMLSLDKRTLTDIIKTVCEIIETNGYWAGISSSASHFNSNVYDNELARYSHWVASWGTTKPVLLKGGATQMWQFGGETNKLRSNKINGQVIDQDYCFVDYPTLIKKTDKGNPKLDKDALANLAEVHDVSIVKKILEYRKYEKLLSTYANGIYDQRDAENRVHGSINQTEATTGRMSITKPALQTLPKKDKRIRRIFLPDDNHELWFMDLDQVEYRLFAHYAKIPGLIESIKNGYDVHAATAALLFNKDVNELIEKVHKGDDEASSLRSRAKTINFALIYGVGQDHLAEMLKCTP